MVVRKGSKTSKGVSVNPRYLVYTKVLGIVILGLILLSLVYVLFLGKGKVVGKGGATGCDTTTCNVPGIVFKTGSIYQVGTIMCSYTSDYPGLCLDTKSLLTCDDQNLNTVPTSNQKNFLCEKSNDKYQWIYCSISGQLSSDKKLWCDDSLKWATCISETFYNIKKGQIYCNPSDEVDLCDTNEKTSLDGKYFCKDNLWIEKCNTEASVNLDRTKACFDFHWKECNSNGLLTSDNKYLCYIDDSNKNWYGCNIEGDSGYKKNQYLGSFVCSDEGWEPVSNTVELTAPAGFYWETPPVDSSSVSTENCVKINTQTNNGYIKDPVCCPSADFCSNSNYISGPDLCYSKNTIYREFGPASTSDFLCSNDGSFTWLICDSKYNNHVSNDDKFLCTGGDQTTYEWQLCKDNGILKENHFYCENIHWKVCNNTFIDTMTDDGQYYCDGKKWGKDFTLGDDQLYEIDITNGKESKNFNTLKEVTLCDEDTINYISKATTCYTGGKAVLDSVSALNKGNKKPLVYGTSSFKMVFLYEKEQKPKKVSFHLLKDVSSNDVSLTLKYFTSNLINERRLMLNVNGEYYLVSYPKSDSFSFSNLKLVHVPTLEEFSPVSIAGNKYQFSVLGGKVVTFSVEGAPAKVKITSTLPLEAPASYAVSYNLQKDYELPFSKDKPLTLVDLGNKILTVCGNDNSGDAQSLLVCEDNKAKLTLQKDVLQTTSINDQKVALLYQLVNGKKQGFVFWRYDISGSNTDLNYNNFIDDLRAGRRVALTFQDATYLLGHPVANFTTLPQTSLSSYNEGAKAVYPASGGEKKVEFLIPEGKLILERDYNVPPPPFKIHGLTKKQITETPIDLKKQLFTSFSTHVSISVDVPSLGIIAKHDDDVKDYKPEFKIEYGGQNPLSLLYSVPIVLENNALLYYFSTTIDGKAVIKTVKVYYVYDISSGKTADHPFNDQFLDVFTAGNELALSFDGQYYLLGYQGATQDQKQFFELEKLTLRMLNTTEKFTGQVNAAGQEVLFNVPNGKISVTVKPGDNKIIFKSVGKDEAVTEIFDASLSPFILASNNKVKIGNDVFNICDSADSAGISESVLVCGTNLALAKFFTNQFEIINQNYLFVYKGMMNGLKQVHIYFVDNLDIGKSLDEGSFSAFVKNVKAGKSKAFKLKDKDYFEIIGTDKLSSFALRKIPSGELYPIQNVKTSIEGLQNGTFAYKQFMVFAQQQWQGNAILLNLKLQNQWLLTEEGYDVSEPTFVPSIGAPAYKIQSVVVSGNENLKKVVIQEYNPETTLAGKVVFLQLLPEHVPQKVLLSNGEIITVEVVNVKEGKIHISKAK